MRMASWLVKDHRVSTVTIFLIVAALAAGIVACDGARTYQLTISSGSGGNVATPGEGTYAYGAGIVVQLVATPEDGYEFRSWTGDTQDITNLNAASTTIVMNGSYAVVANFETEGGTGPGEGPSEP